jgi:hypothetical protein
MNFREWFDPRDLGPEGSDLHRAALAAKRAGLFRWKYRGSQDLHFADPMTGFHQGNRYRLDPDRPFPAELVPYQDEPKDDDAVARFDRGEPVDMVELPDDEFARLAARWNELPENERWYSAFASGGYVPGRYDLAEFRKRKPLAAWYLCRTKYDGPVPARYAAPTPSPQDPEQPEPRQPKKDKTMTPIQITNPILIDGAEASTYSASDRSRLLQAHEQEIKRLEALEFKTQETLDEIAALRAGVVAAIAEFDKEYAARKAASK